MFKDRLKDGLKVFSLLAAACVFAAAGTGCETHQTLAIGNNLSNETTRPVLSSPITLRVERDHQIVTFRVLPLAGSASPALLHNSEPVIEIGDNTLAYAYGTRPVVRGVRTVAAATGTQFGFRSSAGVEILYVHRPASAAATKHKVRFMRRDPRDERASVGDVLELDVGEGAVYRADTNQFERFRSGAAQTPPDVQAFIDETKAFFSSIGSP